MPNRRDFYSILNVAITDIVDNGFDTEGRIAHWMAVLRKAAEQALRPEYQVNEMLRSALGAIYTRLIERGQIVKYHPGISKFTIQQISPRLRAELDKRIMASARLIRMNREEAIDKVLRRFSAWSTSIPAGGSKAQDKADVKASVKKSITQLPFEERRVIIDQGHKFTASLNNILAKDNGAIALIWRSHWRQAGYDYREDHKERDGNVYLLRGCWADDRGLVRPGSAGFYDRVTACGEEIFCRCYATYLYSLSAMPDDMLTKKGRDEIERVRMASDKV